MAGSETLFVTLARYRNLCPEMEPEFALCFEGRLADELRAAGVRVHMMGEVRVRRPLTVMRARRQMKQLLKVRDFEVAVCHMAWPHAVFGSVARSCDLPLVFWLHSATNGSHWLEQIARITPPDLSIAPSSFAGATFPAAFPGKQARVINYAVPPPDQFLSEERQSVRAELDTACDAVVIVQASRTGGMERSTDPLGGAGGAPRSRRLDILDRWGSASVLMNQSIWLLCGNSLSALASRNRCVSLDRGRMFPKLLEAADIYCQPNTGTEGLPVVFAEALYVGLPIVSSNLGGFWEVVDESCGVLVEPGSSWAVAAALGQLMLDKELRNWSQRSIARSPHVRSGSPDPQTLRSVR